ncbi:alpha/beta family hydrolase [Halomonas piscis]|uniref:alpha/beta family hydrolase n=1 Tax=Halomonas piscis TaxID=3031727 RepID=UPI002898E78D|nr:alpha/beta family hydrolase [Halomonas piscis]
MSHHTRPIFSRLTETRLPAALSQASEAAFIVANHGLLRVCGEPGGERLLFAHGAGAGVNSPFMRQFVASLAGEGLQVLAFEFSYMQRMRETGRRRPPPPVATLVEEYGRWHDLVARSVDGSLWVGGKSMGGRVASMLAARRAVDGLVIAGYPFHPPRAPEKRRLSHWPDVCCPSLILQGERDPFGKREEVEGYTLPPNVTLAWLADGDHDFVPRRASGLSQQNLIDEGAHRAACFVRAEEAGFGKRRQASSMNDKC